MEDFIKKLNHEMLTEFEAINAKLNPIELHLDKLNFDHLSYIFGQYSLFSKNITNFLLKAFYSMSYSGWDELRDELIQNIKEELNLDDLDIVGRVPHYVLLRQGFHDAKIEVGETIASHATKNFMNSVLAVMEDTNPSIVAGGVYALESSAVPELDMVYTWVEKSFRLINQEVPIKITNFFRSHVDEIEIGHEMRMQEVCRKYIIDDQKIKDFAIGFKKIMNFMDSWWNGLLNEALENKVKIAS